MTIMSRVLLLAGLLSLPAAFARQRNPCFVNETTEENVNIARHLSDFGLITDETALSADDEEEEPVSTTSSAFGIMLAIIGGSAYAVGAMIVSLNTKWKESGNPSPRASAIGILAWCIMNAGGLCVTFAYGSGVSVPLLNAFVYSTNLFLNMVFQISLKISPYTKNMRCGTLLFVLVAIQLGQLAPPPVIQCNWKQDLTDQTGAIVWMVGFTIITLGSFVTLLSTHKRPRNSTIKMWAWAIHIACWGSFTDNWAKINGVLNWWPNNYEFSPVAGDGVSLPFNWPYYVSFGIYLPTGAWVMVMSVWAMAATHVSVYVPANLCVQLCMNTISAFALWHEKDNVGDKLVPYIVGYILCCMAVYITAEEMDILADVQNIREISKGGLSNGQASSPFGSSLVGMAGLWTSAQERDDPAEREKALRVMLTEGADAKAFRQSDLIDLSMRLWARVNPRFLPTGTSLGWMQRTQYFKDYIAQDAAFGQQLEQALPADEVKVMEQDQQQDEQEMQKLSETL